MKAKTREYSDDTLIVDVSGEVDLYNVSELKKVLFRVCDGSKDRIACNLSKVTYMDSSGIGALVAGHKKMKAHNRKFILVDINDEVLNIMKLATLDSFFTILDSEEELI